jgi:hypothetical protein
MTILYDRLTSDVGYVLILYPLAHEEGRANIEAEKPKETQ